MGRSSGADDAIGMARPGLQFVLVGPGLLGKYLNANELQ
jgi:hypothetical protein